MAFDIQDQESLDMGGFLSSFFINKYTLQGATSRAEDRPQQFLISMNMMHQILCSVSDEVGMRGNDRLDFYQLM